MTMNNDVRTILKANDCMSSSLFNTLHFVGFTRQLEKFTSGLWQLARFFSHV